MPEGAAQDCGAGLRRGTRQPCRRARSPTCSPGGSRAVRLMVDLGATVERIRRGGRSGALALACLLGLGAPVLAEPRCTAPHELLEDDGDLPLTAAAIGRKQPIRIVAIGGA